MAKRRQIRMCKRLLRVLHEETHLREQACPRGMCVQSNAYTCVDVTRVSPYERVAGDEGKSHIAGQAPRTIREGVAGDTTEDARAAIEARGDPAVRDYVPLPREVCDVRGFHLDT